MAKKIAAPNAKINNANKNIQDSPDVNISGGDHFASRNRVNDFSRIMRSLPDPDPVLKKMGQGITALQALLSDSHLESVWGVRCAAASGAEWFMAAGDDSKAAQETADAFAAELKDMDIPRIIEEMMDAVAFGYSPLEILWTAKEEKWGIENIVGKPAAWFEFNNDNKLVIKTGVFKNEELPDNRFLLVQHRPSYANPYGVKVFSKCFWPVTFKKNGFRWWTVFVEKYGGAFLFGKYPLNASEEFKNKLLESLVSLNSDAVAIIPEGADIAIQSANDKKGGSDVHSSYIQMANAEISKAVLGQTLTTEIGERGSYAAASAHDLVRKDIAGADRRRISAAFNRLSVVYTFYNFGADAVPPLFQFVKDEDLQIERAERDTKLYQAGWRPTKKYFLKQYGMSEEDFEIQSAGESGGFQGFNNDLNKCRPMKKTLLQTLFSKVLTSKETKKLEKDSKLMDKFDALVMNAAQKESDKTVDSFVDALGSVKDFDDAFEVLGSLYESTSPEKCAALINEVRYAASQIGAHSAKQGGGKNA